VWVIFRLRWLIALKAGSPLCFFSLHSFLSSMSTPQCSHILWLWLLLQLFLLKCVPQNLLVYEMADANQKHDQVDCLFHVFKGPDCLIKKSWGFFLRKIFCKKRYCWIEKLKEKYIIPSSFLRYLCLTDGTIFWHFWVKIWRTCSLHKRIHHSKTIKDIVVIFSENLN